MARVLVSDSLSKEGLEVLEKAEGISHDYKPGLSEDDLAAAISGYDGLVIRSGSKVTSRVIAAADQLRVIGRAGIGVDNVDKEAASRRGIIVMNTPTGNAVTTAEHALSLLFAVARKIGQADATMKQGIWEKKKLQGRELTGKILGVVGLGNIGRIVADRALGLRMNVIAYDPVVTPERAAELGVALVTLDELFARADAITFHTPLTPETKGLVCDANIAKMRKGVIIINAARGAIVEEAALVRGLQSGHVLGAGIDVFAQEPCGLTELVKQPNVVATPHLGASTDEAQTRVAVEIAEQVVAYLTSGTITNSVNVPSVSSEMAPVLGPYTKLAERLGQFLGQVEKVAPRQITVECVGEVANLTVAPIVSAALAGLLGKFFEEPVNGVNAPVLAKDRGIEVRELKSATHAKYATLIRVTVSGEGGEEAVVAGTLASDRTPRLVRWGRYELDAHLEGTNLVVVNADQPGVIGFIGTVLGEANVNVARMQMGLDTKAQAAASLWALDSVPAAAMVAKIGAGKAIKSVTCITLG
ncbi:MAG: phosphoglycerate dehydrogenase [Polyangiaceae bacterium]|nr:phosphoglycerate dehydrogenase [Polyangiaceae bacterium]